MLLEQLSALRSDGELALEYMVVNVVLHTDLLQECLGISLSLQGHGILLHGMWCMSLQDCLSVLHWEQHFFLL